MKTVNVKHLNYKTVGLLNLLLEFAIIGNRKICFTFYPVFLAKKRQQANRQIGK